MITRGRANPVWRMEEAPPSIRLDSLPPGALVAADILSPYQYRYGAAMVFRVAAVGHPGYPAGSVTLITDCAVDSIAFDAAEPQNPDAWRKTEGGSRYALSNVSQWLESDGAPGAWYAPQHPYDTAPVAGRLLNGCDAYAHREGFLAAFSPGFRASLLETQIVTARCQLDGGGSEVLTRRMFLASSTEVGLTNENGIAEGALFPIFSDRNARICSLTPQARQNAETAYDSAVPWILRTPRHDSTYIGRLVSKSGLRTTHSPFCPNGLRPACNLAGSTAVSAQAQDGVYRIL